MIGRSAEAFDGKLFKELVRGATITFENAEALFHEATMLYAAKALSRALFLHQISLEECAKVQIIGEWATSVLGGVKVNEKQVLAELTRHASKNRTNAFLLEGSAAEKAANERGDWKVASEEFKKIQDEFHAASNTAKNASLYVDFQDRKFVAPVDQITADIVAETASRNKRFLALTHPYVRMLLNWENAPEDARESIVEMMAFVEATKADATDDTRALVERILEVGRERLAKQRKRN